MGSLSLLQQIFPVQESKRGLLLQVDSLPTELPGKPPPASGGDVGDLGGSLSEEDILEEGMAAHSSILAWRVPWTVQSMVLQRVRHD